MLRVIAILLPLAACAAATARAGDQDEARAAFESGGIRPLTEVLASGRGAVPGDVVSVDLRKRQGRWIYELKILAEGGRRREVEIDARTLAVIEVEDED